MTRLMLVCRQAGEHEDGPNEDKCVMFDEQAHAGPFTDFGKLLLAWKYEKVNSALVDKVKKYFPILEHHARANGPDIVKWFQDHEGCSVQIESWMAA